jgi:phosphoglycerate kinase
MKLRSIREVKDLKGKRVLVRVDFNVPIKDGKVTNDARIRVSLATIEFLLKEKAKVIILSHLGRPRCKVDEKLKLNSVAKKLEELLKVSVKKLDDCVGGGVAAEIEKMQEGEIILLENTRFHSAEKENERNFVRQIVSLGDVFVNDAFGVAHRKHASNFGVAEKLSAYAGLSLIREVETLSRILEEPQKPLVLVLGGAKIDTKIGVLKKFSQIADTILLGGGLANTFLVAEGFEVGASLYEKEKLEIAKEVLIEADQNDCKFVLPSDAVCLDASEEISENSQTSTFPTSVIPASMKILDIGAKSIQQFSEIIAKAKMVVWNGPVGLFEFAPFEAGSKKIASACAQTSAVTILGGGDTITALEKFKISFQKFTHVSTGGGAMLEFLEGKKMPAIEVLQKN